MEKSKCDNCGAVCIAKPQDGLCDACRRRAKRAKPLKINPRCECGVTLHKRYIRLRKCSRCCKGLLPLLRTRPSQSNPHVTPPDVARRIMIYQDRVARREAGEIVPDLFAGFERDLRLEHGVKDDDES